MNLSTSLLGAVLLVVSVTCGVQALELKPPPVKNLRIPDELGEKKADILRELIDDYRRAGDVGGTSKAMKKILKRWLKTKKSIDLAITDYYIGCARRSLRDDAGAMHSFRLAIKKNPKFYEAHTLLALLLSRTGSDKESLAHFEKAIEIYPHYTTALEAYALELVRQRQGEKALPILKELVTIETSDAREAYLAELKEYLEGPAWGTVYRNEMGSYIVTTGSSQRLADRVAETMERALRLYVKFFPNLKRQGEKLEVQVYTDKKAFEIAGGGLMLDDARYSPLLKRLKVLHKVDYEATSSICVGFGFEQLASSRARASALPPWLLYGCREFFKKAVLELIDESDFFVRPEAFEHSSIIMAIRSARYFDLEELMLMGDADFEENRKAQCQSWSIVYFCAQGGSKKYRQALSSYVDALSKGASLPQAYVETFGKLSSKRFDKDWKRYIVDTLPKLLR